MKATESLGTQKIWTQVRAKLGDIDEVDLLGAKRSLIMPDLHPTKWAGAIVVHGERRFGHAGYVGSDSAASYVAEARPCR